MYMYMIYSTIFNVRSNKLHKEIERMWIALVLISKKKKKGKTQHI